MRTRAAMLGRRAYAVSALSSAVLQSSSLRYVHSVVAAILMAAMVIACLYCASDIWVREAVRAWVLVASMNLVMIAVHLPMSFAHHHGSGVGAMPVMPGSTTMAAATMPAGFEVAVAAVVLFVRTCAPQQVFRP